MHGGSRCRAEHEPVASAELTFLIAHAGPSMQTMQPSNPFETLDPAWAWAPWQPAATRDWNVRSAAALLRRAGFGASTAELKQALSQTPADMIAGMLKPLTGTISASADDMARGMLAANNARGLSAWWLHKMLTGTSPLQEKMTLFWHGHFATAADKVKTAQLMYDQNQLLRTHALGSLQQMVHAIAKDPAMLIYLDSDVNRKAHPNENFARELMELFCLGEGNYTERDVQELARCFTGWEVRRNQFRFNSYQHDAGSKHILTAEDVESGEQAIDAVLRSPHLAQFIVGKLFRFFIADEPKPPADLLRPLAEQLVSEGLRISGVLGTLLGSQLMFAASARGRKIRSPIDWACNWINALEITTNLKKISDRLNELGQAVFFPPNVKGWDGGRAWINSSTLVGRTNFVRELLTDESTRFAEGSLTDFMRSQRIDSIPRLIEWLEDTLLAVPLSERTREQLAVAMDIAGGTSRWEDCLVLAASLAEMQLS